MYKDFFFLHNKYMLGFAFFLLTYPLDFIAYMLGGKLGVNIPIGFLGVVISIFFIVIFFLIERKSKVILVSVIFIFLIIGMFFIMLFSNNSRLDDYFYLLKIVGAFLSGIAFINYIYQVEIEKLKVIIGFLWLLMILLLITIGLTEGDNYLRLSDAFALTSLFLLGTVNKPRYQIIIFVFSVIGLYYLESRSGLFLFLISSIFLMVLKNNVIKAFLYIMPFIILSYLYIQNINSSITDYNDNRFLRIIFSKDSDTSLNARNYLNEFGWSVYKNNFYFGDFGYSRHSLGEGMYAHNYISFLAEFGLMGLLVLAFFTYSFVVFFIIFFKDKEKNYSYLVLGFVLFGSLGLIFSKSFHWIYIYFCMGAILSYSFNLRKEIS